MFMSPDEIFYYRKNTINPYKLDSYSLGVLLYFFLHGKFFCEASNATELKKWFRSKTEVPIDQSLSYDLNKLLLDLLIQKPEKRLTVADLLASPLI
jgi:serine/threonine protein kinase